MTTDTITPTLNAFLRAVISNSDEVDPRKLAAVAYADTPEELVHAFYQEALVYAVRTVRVNARSNARSNALIAQPGDRPESEQQEQTTRKPNTRSRLRESIADAWEKYLRQGITVENGSKAIGELTIDDVTWLEQSAHARETQARKSRTFWGGFKELMQEHNATNASDIPAASFRNKLGEPI